MKRLVVLTGAGISAESGIRTFRDSDGLWEEHNVMDVATPEAWARNPELVQAFYNQRRRELLSAQPNPAHLALAQAEADFQVHIVTQNVDNLHERAGSTRVLHLHGLLTQARSTADERLIYPVEGWEIRMGDRCAKGSQLRPHIVWFGEPVPAMRQAIEIVASAQIFAIVGTSLNVYPAAGLVGYVPAGIPMFLVDPKEVAVAARPNLTILKAPASTGVPTMLGMIKSAPP